MSEIQTFFAAEATRQNQDLTAAIKALIEEVVDQFFNLWETEGDPRKAGSVIAHHLMDEAAKIAAFGAVCAGREPDMNQWLALCRERMDAAILDVKDACETVEETDARIDDAQ